MGSLSPEHWIIAIALTALVWWLFRRKDRPPASMPVAEAPVKDARRTALERSHALLSGTLDRCQDEHAPAVSALLWLAGSDGSVSKQETRNIFRFCEQQGTAIGAEVYTALEHLNNGLSFQLGANESVVTANLAEIAKRDIQYRVAFMGAAHALCGNAKRLSTNKQAFLDKVNQLVAAGST